MECRIRKTTARKAVHTLACVLLAVVVVFATSCSRQAEPPRAGTHVDLAAMDAAAEEAAADAAAAPVLMVSPMAPPPAEGLRNRNGSQLAYEQELRVRIAADRIPANLAATREACVSQRFGPCNLLGEDMGAGQFPTGTLTMRAAPAAVVGLSGIASHGGEVAQRTTRAEDLADAVRDNGLRRKRLSLQHQKLAEILDRRDLKPVDLFAITERMSQIEAELDAADQEAAQQQRRITTNLLTITFESASVTMESSQASRAWRGLGATWDGSVASLISGIGAALPGLLLLTLLVTLVRLAWKRRAKRHADA